MNKFFITSVFLASVFIHSACAQKKSKQETKLAYAKNNNSLLWEISGNGLNKPSYLFGTIHLICKDEAILSREIKSIISNVDKIYFEINMENMMSEALTLMFKMNMKDNQTLKDLLSPEDYNLVKNHFTDKSSMSMLPFSSVEKMKPLFVQSLLAKDQMDCDGTDGMEMKIMAENKISNQKPTGGLETASFQMSIFDSIPYKEQAQDLVKIIKASNKTQKNATEDLGTLTKLYKTQNLDSIVSIMNADSDALTTKYADLMLYNRNKSWIPVIEDYIKHNAALFAVGAAHLGGKGGVIDLLKKKGYVVKPVKNNMNPII